MADVTRSRIAVALSAYTALSVCRATGQCPDGTPPPCAVQRPAPSPGSVAVLTFQNVTRDTSSQYLAEGLADQISTRLGRVARLTIVSRTAVRRLREPERLSVQEIGRRLNAANLVNGTIRVAGGRVRVNVEAVRSATGEAVWSAAYDRASDDLVGLEEAIASEVAAGVAGRLSPQERRALGSRMTSNGAAYEQFLRGNGLMARRSAASMQAAVEAYRAATAADSGFADAYARMAYALALCESWGCGDRDSLLALSRDAATRALQLNPRSSDAWMGRAYMLVESSTGARAHRDDTLLASLAAFRRAVDLNPRNDEAWHQYGSTLRSVSDSASVDALRRALALDPARAISYGDLSATYYVMGLYDRALATMDSALALEPLGAFRAWRTLYRLASHDTAGAVADARLVAGAPFARAVLAAFAHDSALTQQAETRAAGLACSDFDLPAYLLWTGRREAAIRALLRCGPSLWIRLQLRMAYSSQLLDDPRIQALRAASDSVLARARWR